MPSNKLAEHALAKIEPWFPQMQTPWTEHAMLPGGDLGCATSDEFVTAMQRQYAALPPVLIRQLAHRHGSAVPAVLAEARKPTDLGEYFGDQLFAREVDYFIAHEWATSAEDVLWRRTKAGLNVNSLQKQSLTEYVARRVAPAVR